ncbi:MAG: NADAR family protein [Alphaproteobacteria bacterium]|nr:NADAR family protein [Alphaproteobacteria bacterium]
MRYDVAWLRAKGAWEGIFFWGHRQKVKGVPDKSCCSQWFPAGFDVDGVHYPTAEHWMMAGKARMFGDEDAVDVILSMEDPANVKKVGRKVRGFDEARWNAAAYALVREGNVQKFRQNEKLGEWLRGTAGKVLVEASPYDAIWGIGLKPDDPACEDIDQWRGTNWLGFAIMEARDALMEGS